MSEGYRSPTAPPAHNIAQAVAMAMARQRLSRLKLGSLGAGVLAFGALSFGIATQTSAQLVSSPASQADQSAPLSAGGDQSGTGSAPDDSNSAPLLGNAAPSINNAPPPIVSASS